VHIVYPAVVSALLFSIGVYGVLVRRNTILVLMSVELMLNAVNLNLVAFDVWLADRLHSGQVLTLFVIVIAAAEVGLGLAIVLALYRNRRTVDIDHLRDLAEPTDEPTEVPAIAGTADDEPAGEAAHSATTSVRGPAIARERPPDYAAPAPTTSDLAPPAPTRSDFAPPAVAASPPAQPDPVQPDPVQPHPAEAKPATLANPAEPTEGRPPATAEPNEHRNAHSAQAPQGASDHSDGASEADRIKQAEAEGGREGEQPVKRGGTL
jgi:NADH-quinone oxidoreductase subunit K